MYGEIILKVQNAEEVSMEKFDTGKDGKIVIYILTGAAQR